MKKIITLLFAAACFITQAQTVSKRDKKFAECTASHGMVEVKMSQLAQAKAVTPEVKELAKTMEQHRGNANTELKSIAAKKNITLPSELTKKQQRKYDKLAKKDGKKFDKCYAKKMAKCHKKELCKFKKQAKKGDDAELKNFASTSISTLEQHREQSKKACKAINTKS